jgi:hypothetical protein
MDWSTFWTIVLQVIIAATVIAALLTVFTGIIKGFRNSKNGGQQ